MIKTIINILVLDEIGYFVIILIFLIIINLYGIGATNDAFYICDIECNGTLTYHGYCILREDSELDFFYALDGDCTIKNNGYE